MKKLLLMAVFIFPASSLSSPESEKIEKHCAEWTISVMNGFFLAGSAVVIRKFNMPGNKKQYFAITCNHVTDNIQNLFCASFVINEDGLSYNCVDISNCIVVDFNTKYDLSIISFISSKDIQVSKIDLNTKIEIGNNVYKTGCGLTSRPLFSTGTVSGKVLNDIFLQTSVVHGDSGGGIFNKNGELIAVTQKMPIRNDIPIHDIAVAIPLNKFKNWIDKYEDGLSYIINNDEMPPTLPILELTLVECNKSPIKRSRWLNE